MYIAGLVIGNSKFIFKENASGFFESVAWLFQVVMFLSLGLLVNPKELLSIYMIGLLVTFVMVIVARPASVFLCLLPFRKISNRAKHYVSWVGLKGAVPIIFATYPLTAGLENAGHMFNIVFFVTLISLIIQGTTINYAAEKLKLSNPSE
ncbi:K(+)/H(+) antiporter NhaP2 [bioreactor metagenome]|uniref:K(+)/H(+) antiporter NhaP2 n=1 Tax=bioreactor metagenome TaxID=1076179 RepID=A0A645FRD6_9ZZZZ